MPNLPNVDVRNLEHDNIQTLLELDPATMDPNKHYRWVRAEARKLGNAKIKGYTIEYKEKGGVQTRAGYMDDTADGSIRVQDVVLMSCDISSWRGRKRSQVKQSNKRLSAPKSNFKKNARARRVRILNEEDE